MSSRSCVLTMWFVYFINKPSRIYQISSETVSFKMVARTTLLDMRFRVHILLVWVFYSYFNIIKMNWKSVNTFNIICVAPVSKTLLRHISTRHWKHMRLDNWVITVCSDTGRDITYMLFTSLSIRTPCNCVVKLMTEPNMVSLGIDIIY